MPRKPTPTGAPKCPTPSEDHRARLVALRDVLTASIAEAGYREQAALAGQLRAVLADLAAMPEIPVEADVVDDLTARRARGAAAPRAKRPATG